MDRYEDQESYRIIKSMKTLPVYEEYPPAIACTFQRHEKREEERLMEESQPRARICSRARS